MRKGLTGFRRVVDGLGLRGGRSLGGGPPRSPCGSTTASRVPRAAPRSPGGAPRSGRSGSAARARAGRAGRRSRSARSARPARRPRSRPAVWFEIRLPSPKTTGLPLTRRIGCTTCACCPTIASIGGRAGEPPGERALRRRHGVHVLGAPVEVHDHDPGPAPPGAAGVAQDQPRRGPVHRPGVRHGLPVRDRGVGEERHAHALDPEHRRAPPRARRARRSGGLHAGAAERAQRGPDPVLARVERVVRRRAARVPADAPDRAREVRRRAEARVALHRRPARAASRRGRGPGRRARCAASPARTAARSRSGARLRARARAARPACGSAGHPTPRP